MEKRDIIEVLPTRDGGWMWHIKAANGELIQHGEVLTRKFTAVRGARRFAERHNPNSFRYMVNGEEVSKL